MKDFVIKLDILSAVCQQERDLSVFLSVREHISETARPIFTVIVHVVYIRDVSAFLWWRCSGFMDDVIFEYNDEQ